MSSKLDNIVIVGGGHGAAIAAVTMRKLGIEAPIQIIGEEPETPYQRPPLSKAYLLGEMVRERLQVRHPDVFKENNIELTLGQKVMELNRTIQQLLLESGEVVAYDKLVLATGGVPRKLNISGSDLNGSHCIRNLADIDLLRSELAAAHDCVVIGAGFIGLEAAAVFSKLGKSVTVLEAADGVMGRSVSSETAAFFKTAHENHGVKFNFDCFATEFVGKAGRVKEVQAADGRVWPADVIVVGIGIEPADSLAKTAGLTCDRGVLVDEFCRTDDPNIYAIGDCTRHRNLRYEGHISLESVQNAVDQAKIVASGLAGNPQPYNELPWFWSEQFDLKLQIAGRSQGANNVLIYDDGLESGKLGVCHFAVEHLIAVETVNRAADHMVAGRLLSGTKPITRSDLAGEGASLKAMAGF